MTARMLALASTFVLLVALPSCVGDRGLSESVRDTVPATPPAALNSGSGADSVERAAINALRTFFRSETKQRIATLAPTFIALAGVTEESLALESDKEWYAVRSIQSIRTRKSSTSDSVTVSLQLEVDWAFEGFEGYQTCHFRLISTSSGWRVEWFLC